MEEFDAWRVALAEAQRLRQLIALAEHADTAHLVPQPLQELQERLAATLLEAQAALDQARRSLRGGTP